MHLLIFFVFEILIKLAFFVNIFSFDSSVSRRRGVCQPQMFSSSGFMHFFVFKSSLYLYQPQT